MSIKYKPGDKVKIWCGLHTSKNWCDSGVNVIGKMAERAGDVVTIDKIVDADNNRYYIMEDHNEYCWHSSMFDGLAVADESAEAVSHPKHYNVGKIEVIDFIEDKKLNFSLGNAVKYIARCQHKVGGTKRIEDLKKAIWYIQHQITMWEKEKTA